MTAKIAKLSTRPEARWPGHATIDAAGARIACEMLAELAEAEMDQDGVSAADLCCLPNWPRQGRPFRNIVAEQAAKAQEAGPEALAAYFAVLSDYIATTAQGSLPEAAAYGRYCGGKQP